MNASEDSLLSRQRQVMMKSRSQESENRIQNSESRIQNTKAETASTDSVFLFFWLLASGFWILLFPSSSYAARRSLAQHCSRARAGVARERLFRPALKDCVPD